jgi:predicted regulator of Ras-like GTPase activity (Roadblock/LC7/MglB family)
MQLDDDLLLCDDLPPEAKRLLDEADQAVAIVRARTDRAITAIRAEAERKADEIKRAAEGEVAAVQAEAAKELSPLLRDLFHQLKALQAEFMKEGKLDEALAVRNRLRGLRSDLFGVKADPGNLTDYSSADFNKALVFEVVGSADGNIWGTDIYTGDSRLAVAAVHSGAVRVGERALVRVTLTSGSERTFDGSERYGIRSLDYGNYSLAFRVERI